MSQQVSYVNLPFASGSYVKRESAFQKHTSNLHEVPVTNSYSMQNSPVNQTQLIHEYEDGMRRLQNQVKIYKEQTEQKNMEIENLQKTNRQLIKQLVIYEQKTNMVQTNSANKNMSFSMHSNTHNHLEVLAISAQSKVQRLTLKLQQRNLDYEQLMKKYQQLEQQMDNLQDYVQDIQREKKFMAQKLRDIEIHTEGDQVAGQLQNKLVLMSTQVMRLGNINRNKNQQCNNLHFRIKKLQQQKQQLQRGCLQYQIVIQEYRQKIRILESQLKLVQGNLTMSINLSNTQKQQELIMIQRQLDKANALIRNKSDVIDQLERKNQQLERKNHENAHKSNIDMRQVKHEQEERIITLQSEVSKYVKMLKSEQQEIQSLEEKLDRCRKEKEKWIKQKQVAEQQRNSWEYQFKECKAVTEKLQVQFHNYKMNTVAQFQNNSSVRVQQEIRRYEERQRNIKSQMDRVAQKNSQLIRELKDKEERFTEVNLEFKRYQEKIIVLNKQIGQFKRMQSVSHSQKKLDSQLIQKIAKYQEKIALLSQQIERVNYICEEYKHKIQNQENIINQYRSDLQRKNSEVKGIEKKQDIVSKDNQFLKVEVEKWKQAYEQLKNLQEQNVKRSINSQNQELEYMKQQYEKAIHQNQNLEKVLTESRSAKSLHQKEKQYFQLQDYYRRKQTELKDHYTQIQRRYEQKLQQMKLSEQKLYTQLKRMKQNHFQYDSVIRQLSQQIQRLNSIISYKSDEVLHQRKQRQLIEHNLQICQNALKKYKNQSYSNQELQQRMRRITFEQEQKLEMYQNQHNKIQNQLKQKARSLRQLENRYIQCNSQKDILQSELLQKERQIHQKYAQAMQMRSHQDVLQAVNQVRQSNTRLEQSVYMIQKQWMQKVEKKENQILELRNQVSSLRFKQSQTSIQQGSQVQQLKREIEKCYRIISEKEESKQLQIRNIRMQYEKHHQEKIAKIESLQYKLNQYDNALKNLNSHMETVKSEIKNKDMEIQHQININHRIQSNIKQVRQQNNTLKLTIQSKEREVQQLQRKLLEYQGLQQKIGFIGKQKQQTIQRMKISYHESQKDKQKYQSQARKLQTELNEIRSQNSKSSQKVIRFEQQNKSLEQQVKQLKRQILHQRQISSEYLRKMQQLIKTKDQYQVRLIQMSKELQRLTKILSSQKHGSQQTLQKLQRQLRILQGQKQAELRRIQDQNTQKIQLLSRQIERLNQVISENVNMLRSNQSKQAQQKEIIQRNTKQYYERQLILFRQRMQEDRKQMRLQQNSIIKNHNQLKAEYDILLQQRQALKFDNIRVTSDNRKLNEQMHKIEGQKFRLQDQSKRGFTEYQKYVTEINNLKLFNQNLQTRIITLQQFEFTANQNQKLIRVLKTESNQNAEKLRNILNQNSKIVTEIGQFRRQNNNLKRLYQQQAYKVKMKDRQIEDLKIQQQIKFSQLNPSVPKQQDFITQRAKLMERIRVLEKTKSQYEERLVLTAQQVQRLSVVVQTKTEQQISMRQLFDSKNRQLQQRESRAFQQKQASRKTILNQFQGIEGNQIITKCQQLQKQLKKVGIILQSAQDLNRNLIAENKAIKQRISEFELRYSKLKVEFQILDKLVHQYKDQNHKLKNKIKGIERGTQLNNGVSSQNRTPSGKVLNKVYSKPQLRQQEYQSPFYSPLNEDINNGHNQANKLNLQQLIQQIDRLNSINQDLKNQVADLRLQSTNNYYMKQRFEQNLAVMVMTFAQVESLRNRVKQLENEKEESRNSSLDAIRKR